MGENYILYSEHLLYNSIYVYGTEPNLCSRLGLPSFGPQPWDPTSSRRSILILRLSIFWHTFNPFCDVTLVWPWTWPPEQENPGCSSLTHKIAAIGTWGRHPQNCERDLFRALDLPLATCRAIMHLFAIVKPLLIQLLYGFAL